MFSSWVKNGQPGIYKVWLVTLDPDSGNVLGIDKLPLPPQCSIDSLVSHRQGDRH
jgi:hypothetical protein